MRNFSIIYNKRNDKYMVTYRSPFTDKVRTRAIHSLLSSSDVRNLVNILGVQLINLDNGASLDGFGDATNFSYYSKDSYIELYSFILSQDNGTLKRLFKFIFSESIYFIQDRDSFSLMDEDEAVSDNKKCISIMTSNNVAQYLEDLVYVDVGDLYFRGRKKLDGYTIDNNSSNEFSAYTSYYTLDMLRDLITCNLVRVVNYYKSLTTNYRNADLATVRKLLLSDGIIDLSNCFDSFIENDMEVHEIVTNIHSSFISLMVKHGTEVFNYSQNLLFCRDSNQPVMDTNAYNILKITQRLLNCVNRVKQTYLNIAFRSLFKLPFNVKLDINVGVPITITNQNMLQNIKLYKLIDFKVTIGCKYSELIGYDCFSEFMSMMYSKYSVLLSLVSRLYLSGNIEYGLETTKEFKLLPLGEFTGKHLELLDCGNLRNLRRSSEIQYFTDLNYTNDWCLYTYFKFLCRNGLATKACLVFVDNHNLTTEEALAKINSKLVELQHKLVDQFNVVNMNASNIKFKIWSRNKGLLPIKKSRTDIISKMEVFSSDNIIYKETEFLEYLKPALVMGLDIISDKVIGLDERLTKLLVGNIIKNESSCSVKDTNFGLVSPICGLSDNIKVVVSRFINFKCSNCKVNVKLAENIMFDFSKELDSSLYNLTKQYYTELVELYYKPDNTILLNLLLEIYTEKKLIELIVYLISRDSRVTWR